MEINLELFGDVYSCSQVQQVARATNSYEQTIIEHHLFGLNHELTEIESLTLTFRLNEFG